MVVASKLEGHCTEQFSLLARAFADNFSHCGEAGAACALYYRGQLVANLWGGTRDRHGQLPWQPSTLVNVFSAGKPIIACAVLQLAERGELDLDAPIAELWPDFEQAGKAAVTTRMVLCHRAGLPLFQQEIPEKDIYSWNAMVLHLQKETPLWTPGARQGYQPFTFGWLLGEVVRRVSGKPIDRYIHGAICQPFDIDVHWGLKPEQLDRVADIQPVDPATVASTSEGRAHSSKIRVSAWETEWRNRAFGSPASLTYGTNSGNWRRAVIPAANGHGSALGLAQFYRVLVNGGEWERRNMLSSKSLDLCVHQASAEQDAILHADMRFSLGFMLSNDNSPVYMGPGKEAFGHAGAGGSLAFGDLKNELSFAYVTRFLGDSILGDRRAKNLVMAAYDCL